ncbi:MAG: hypothetical protein WDM76_13155 [Limisphaerales bacterium]
MLWTAVVYLSEKNHSIGSDTSGRGQPNFAKSPLHLITMHKREIDKIETELIDRLDRYGRRLEPTNNEKITMKTNKQEKAAPSLGAAPQKVNTPAAEATKVMATSLTATPTHQSRGLLVRADGNRRE